MNEPDDPAPSSVVKDARALARQRCAEAHVHGDRCDALVLAASELVGNAVRHGEPPVSYDIVAQGEDLVLTVSDSDPTPPGEAADPGADAEGGRGLLLISATARGLGWTKTDEGKQVWARI